MAIWVKAAFAAPLLLSFEQPPTTPDYVKHPAVVQVICENSLGTAFRIAPHKLVSVAHVTSNTGCEVDGQPIQTTYDGPNQDFTLADTPTQGRNFLKVSCEGIQPGHYYWAIGYARGWPKQLRTTLYSRGDVADNGMAILHGRETVIPGQSGGPILNERGEVVATVNAYHPFFRISFVRVLKDTALCNGATA